MLCQNIIKVQFLEIQTSTVQMYQVTIVVMETTQLVLRQFKNF